MKTTTTVTIKSTSIRMFDQKSNEVVHYKTSSLLTMPESREIAKAKNLTFIDKEDFTTSFDVSNDTLLTLQPKE